MIAQINEFLDDCISSGKYIETDQVKLSQESILEIEDILHRYNDKTARTKIRNILKMLIDKSNAAYRDSEYLEYFKCPNCQEENINIDHKYCPMCASKIQWKDGN